MAKERKSNVVPEGFKVVDSKIPFVKFENVGDSFQGTFIETKEMESRKFKNKQTIWICTNEDGEPVQISEKTAMQNYRAMLTKGDEFYIVYDGEIQGSGKQKYKSFTFAVRE